MHEIRTRVINSTRKASSSNHTKVIRKAEAQFTWKWTSNHPANPQRRVGAILIADEKLDLTSRMSFTEAVKQSISFITAAVPIT